MPYEARAGLTYSRQLGYVPVDKTAEAASSTLEDAYDDFAVAQIAKAVGKEADYRFFLDSLAQLPQSLQPGHRFHAGQERRWILGRSG